MKFKKVKEKPMVFVVPACRVGLPDNSNWTWRLKRRKVDPSDWLSLIRLNIWSSCSASPGKRVGQVYFVGCDGSFGPVVLAAAKNAWHLLNHALLYFAERGPYATLLPASAIAYCKDKSTAPPQRSSACPPASPNPSKSLKRLFNNISLL